MMSLEGLSHMTPHDTSSLAVLARVGVAALIGGVALFLLFVGTGGAILSPLLGFAIVGCLVLVQYVLWGRRRRS